MTAGPWLAAASNCVPGSAPPGAPEPGPPGVCYYWGPQPVSWWTLPHIAAVVLVVLGLAAVLGMALARTGNRRYERSRGGRS